MQLANRSGSELQAKSYGVGGWRPGGTRARDVMDARR
jgi:hypothetical protein